MNINRERLKQCWMRGIKRRRKSATIEFVDVGKGRARGVGVFSSSSFSFIRHQWSISISHHRDVFQFFSFSHHTASVRHRIFQLHKHKLFLLLLPFYLFFIFLKLDYMHCIARCTSRLHRMIQKSASALNLHLYN